MNTSKKIGPKLRQLLSETSRYHVEILKRRAWPSGELFWSVSVNNGGGNRSVGCSSLREAQKTASSYIKMYERERYQSLREERIVKEEQYKADEKASARIKALKRR